MKHSKSVVTTDDLDRPSKKAQPLRKQSKAAIRKLYAEKQELWEQELSKTKLQFEYGQILELEFKNAVRILDIAFNPKLINQNLLTPKQEFENAFELYELSKGQADLLENQGVIIKTTTNLVDPKWYNMTRKDFFKALNPVVQDVLRTNGVNYD
jgi:hypothetical protein